MLHPAVGFKATTRHIPNAQTRDGRARSSACGIATTAVTSVTIPGLGDSGGWWSPNTERKFSGSHVRGKRPVMCLALGKTKRQAQAYRSRGITAEIIATTRTGPRARHARHHSSGPAPALPIPAGPPPGQAPVARRYARSMSLTCCAVRSCSSSAPTIATTPCQAAGD
jgi:hypothetical protein